MNFINIYGRFLKNNKNYNFYFYNTNYKILLFLNIKYSIHYNKNYIYFLKIIKFFFIENGFQMLLFENWYKLGIQYNLILKMLI